MIVIAFVWQKNGNQCWRILSPEQRINQKGKLRYCRKCIFPVADRQAVLAEGSHSQYFTGYCSEQNPYSVFNRNEHIDKWNYKLMDFSKLISMYLVLSQLYFSSYWKVKLDILLRMQFRFNKKIKYYKRILMANISKFLMW